MVAAAVAALSLHKMPQILPFWVTGQVIEPSSGACCNKILISIAQYSLSEQSQSLENNSFAAMLKILLNIWPCRPLKQPSNILDE